MQRKQKQQNLKTRRHVTYTFAQTQLTRTHTHTHTTHTHNTPKYTDTKIIAMFKRLNNVLISGKVIYMCTWCTSPEVEVHVGWLALESLSTLHGHAKAWYLARKCYRSPSVWSVFLTTGWEQSWDTPDLARCCAFSLVKYKAIVYKAHKQLHTT